MISTLNALFAPHDPAVFQAAIQGRSRLHLRTQNSEAFKAVLPWSQFNALLETDRLFDDRTRVVLRGRDLPREMWSQVGQDFQRVIFPDQLQRFCQQGLSISLGQVHQGNPAIAAIVAMLEHALPARVQTNL